MPLHPHSPLLLAATAFGAHPVIEEITLTDVSYIEENSLNFPPLEDETDEDRDFAQFGSLDDYVSPEQEAREAFNDHYQMFRNEY